MGLGDQSAGHFPVGPCVPQPPGQPMGSQQPSHAEQEPQRLPVSVLSSYSESLWTRGSALAGTPAPAAEGSVSAVFPLPTSQCSQYSAHADSLKFVMETLRSWQLMPRFTDGGREQDKCPPKTMQREAWKLEVPWGSCFRSLPWLVPAPRVALVTLCGLSGAYDPLSVQTLSCPSQVQGGQGPSPDLGCTVAPGDVIVSEVTPGVQ